ncbi:MAG: hypothetical protein ACE5WD_07885, partial [Candidatus Aminicenantia bacterium]
PSGNKEMIFASDGRVIEHGTTNIRYEDYKKIRKVGPNICIGYAGSSGELFQDVLNDLETKIQNKNLLTISNILKDIILKKLSSQFHRLLEKQYGPLHHHFLMGGSYQKVLRIYYLCSGKRFEKEEIKLHRVKLGTWGVTIKPIGSTEKVQKEIDILANEKLPQSKSIEDIIYNIRFIISKVAEQTHDINNHIFIRRLSRNFKLESYIGYE